MRKKTMKGFFEGMEDPEKKDLEKGTDPDEIEDKFQKYEETASKMDMDEFKKKVSQLFRKEELQFTEVESFPAETANLWFKENVDPDYNNPYAEGTEVKLIELKEDTTLSRVYPGNVNGIGKYGTWMMKKEDLKGLSPEEIRDKYALPEVPCNIVDVEVKAGTRLRMGEAGPVENWGRGGGIQFDTVGERLDKKCFKNARRLEEDL